MRQFMLCTPCGSRSVDALSIVMRVVDGQLERFRVFTFLALDFDLGLGGSLTLLLDGSALNLGGLALK